MEGGEDVLIYGSSGGQGLSANTDELVKTEYYNTMKELDPNQSEYEVILSQQLESETQLPFDGASIKVYHDAHVKLDVKHRVDKHIKKAIPYRIKIEGESESFKHQESNVLVELNSKVLSPQKRLIVNLMYLEDEKIEKINTELRFTRVTEHESKTKHEELRSYKSQFKSLQEFPIQMEIPELSFLTQKGKVYNIICFLHLNLKPENKDLIELRVPLQYYNMPI